MATFQTVIIILGFALIAYFLLRKKEEPKKDDQSFLLMQNQIKEIRDTLDCKLTESHRQMQTQFGQSNQIIRDVTERLATVTETNKQVLNFSEQLKNLERVLTSQKQRGNLGEAGLKLVLENILPPTAFKLQYAFGDGDIVDAMIFTKDGNIPVDAKFSLENYNRLLAEDNKEKRAILEKEFKNDLKKRIDETSKYIKVSKGTMDFAFMFIPAEGIYYDLLVNEVGAVKVDTAGLIDYAFKQKKVIIVSPTTFAAYLHTVLQGLRAFKIEEQTKEIVKYVEQLQRHLLTYEDAMKKVGNNLGTTVGMFNNASAEFRKIDKDVIKITGAGAVAELPLIEKPKSE
ncbi:MAG: DNA recombination protein RmuC [Parcubacteria group bacterium]